MKGRLNTTQKLIQSHLLSGSLTPGEEIGLRIDHVLQQDATGTLVMLELEAIGLDRVRAELAVQYVDHNLLQADFKNADDHKFLLSAARKLGYWYSRAGNGISHVVHMENFGVPGASLLGSDSHTCAAGGIGMLAIGTGGLDVALAAAGEPYYVTMPRTLGVELRGALPDWISAKDVVLEMLRRYGVKGAKGFIIEYFGAGLESLSAWDRHVIANMGTEMGATTSVFPSDRTTRFFLRQQGREADWKQIEADQGADYDATDTINLSKLESLIAKPGSPGDVVPVSEVAGKEISQVVVGSSANPGYRDFWIVSEILKDKQISPSVSLDINPSSRQKILLLSEQGNMGNLIGAGARFHQTGCLGCIGMGQSPASGEISLRTMPRNFPGRSGTKDDLVYLCSPETAAASALTGKITVPSDLPSIFGARYPVFVEPSKIPDEKSLIIPPNGGNDELRMGPNIKKLPELSELEDSFEVPVILKVSDNISTDEILPAGAEVLPLRSNIQEISKYVYKNLSESFYQKATKHQEGHVLVAGQNYAQGSSREHAALAPRYLGQRAVIAKDYARIGWQNLINYGVIPFEFEDESDYDSLHEGDVLQFQDVVNAISAGKTVTVKNKTTGADINVTTNLSDRQKKIVLAGGVINYMREKAAA